MSDRDEAGRFLPAHSIPGPGRNGLYDPSMNEVAYKLALLGLIDDEIAEFFGISGSTMDIWKREYPAFLCSLNDGKTIADANVAASLYQRATGEFVIVEKLRKNHVTGEEEIIKLRVQQPSDPGAAKLWLTNRQGRLWREKSHVEQSGEVTQIHKIERSIVKANAGNSDR